MIGSSVGITDVATTSRRMAALSSLFANGENGFLFEPMSDLTRLFTTSVGPTQVAANDDPVGLMLDRSKWVDKTLAEIVAAQSEIAINGGFSADASWVKDIGWTISGGTFNANTTAFTLSYQGGVAGLVAGTLYRVQFEITTYTSGGVRFRLDGGTSAVGTSRTAAGVYTEYLIAGAGNNQFSLQALGSGFVGSIDNVSVKAIPGNHALQATSTKRPLWKANSGKPYLSPDGTDDAVVTPFLANGSGLTMALAFRQTNTGTIMMGGGTTTGDKRAYIAQEGNGYLNIGWGTGVNEGANPRTNTDITVVVTGDGTGRDVWINGVLTAWGAASGAPDGTGGGMALGGFNNAGTPGNFAAGRIHAALCLNRRATPGEVALITNRFRSTYQ